MHFFDIIRRDIHDTCITSGDKVSRYSSLHLIVTQGDRINTAASDPFVTEHNSLIKLSDATLLSHAKACGNDKLG
jgi:hypothetical protein